MTSNDLEKFVDIMMGLAENYPGTRLTDPGLDMRFEALKDYTIDQVVSAAVKLIKTHRFNSMPTVGDFVSAIDPGQTNKAEIEAGKVIEYLSRFGASIEPRFEDPITRHLMSHRWRWYSWASRVQESELKWWTRDFIRAYNAHAGGAYPLGIDFNPLGELVHNSIGGAI